MQERRRHRLGRTVGLALLAGGVGLVWAGATALLGGGASDAHADDGLGLGGVADSIISPVAETLAPVTETLAPVVEVVTELPVVGPVVETVAELPIVADTPLPEVVAPVVAPVIPPVAATVDQVVPTVLPAPAATTRTEARSSIGVISADRGFLTGSHTASASLVVTEAVSAPAPLSPAPLAPSAPSPAVASASAGTPASAPGEHLAIPRIRISDALRASLSDDPPPADPTYATDSSPD